MTQEDEDAIEEELESILLVSMIYLVVTAAYLEESSAFLGGREQRLSYSMMWKGEKGVCVCVCGGGGGGGVERMHTYIKLMFYEYCILDNDLSLSPIGTAT